MLPAVVLQTGMDALNLPCSALMTPLQAYSSGITLRAIPDVVRFSKYRAAEMQRTVVQIQNLLGVSQFLRILPPASKHFAIGTPGNWNKYRSWTLALHLIGLVSTNIVYPTQSGMLGNQDLYWTYSESTA